MNEKYAVSIEVVRKRSPGDIRAPSNFQHVMKECNICLCCFSCTSTIGSLPALCIISLQHTVLKLGNMF